MLNEKPPQFLVTHSGGFHADELCSSAILSTLFPDAKIIRSRDHKWITPASDRIVFDVGGIFSAKDHAFDHHQRGAPHRKDGNPFSSFGLIWESFGKRYLEHHKVPNRHTDRVLQILDQRFVLPIDLLDNGAVDPSTSGVLAPLSLPSLLESLKPPFDSEGANADDTAFHQALGVTRLIIEAQVAQISATLRAEAVVQDSIVRAGTSRLLELPQGMPYLSAIQSSDAAHFLFVVHPRGQGDWTLGGIRLDSNSFDLRASLPKEWAGLTNEDLEQATGIKGATFCHNGLFIAAAKSRDAILKMASLAIQNVDNSGHANPEHTE